MGEQRVTKLTKQNDYQRFNRGLLDDVQALSYMLDHDWFESDITRMGAEQEIALVHRDTLKPASVAIKALENIGHHPWITTELAAFNLEINLQPHELTGDCFTRTEQELLQNLQTVRECLLGMDTDLVLTGILPTLRKNDLVMENLTPRERYYALMDTLKAMKQGQAFELRLTGIDELLVKHETPLLEACNTSFQVHLQVAPAHFVRMYNLAQTLAGPILAVAANSPIVFGRRLWHESRIALFQQSIDTRSSHDHMRERSPRVQFGGGWLEDSILNIYKEDIARFRVLITSTSEEKSLDMIKNGEVPRLRHLQLHNGTVYRWNRPCYGISDNGKPHLRIENRVLPSGPTVIDEVANTAFWLGTMLGMGQEIEDVTQRISWEDVRDNFGKVARFGIDTQLNWFDDKKVSTIHLVLDQLLPIAEKGLRNAGVREDDIQRYLGVIDQRTRSHMNGARWILRTYTKLLSQTTNQDEALTALTASIMENQQTNQPGHTWEMPGPDILRNYKPNTLKVEEIMTTDLFTANVNDNIAMVTEIMDWRKIRYMPVEDDMGNLIGLITSRLLLRHYSKNYKLERKVPRIIGDIMIHEPITVNQETTLLEAMAIMRENKIGCLPVVKGKELVGIITEMDFLRVSSRLLERMS
jgi:CBS domain-containing protein/gamma-glutamylcysteine synthetase